MKIGILSRNPRLYSTSRLLEEAIASGHQCRVIDTLKCYMDISSAKPAVWYRGQQLDHLDAIIHRKSRAKHRRQPIFSRQTAWLRAPASGIHRMLVPLGAQVSEDQVIGLIADPLGIEETEVRAPSAGVIIGRSNLPLVYAGDALFHIADIHNEATFAAESFHEELMPSDYQPTEDDPSTAPIAL